MAVWELLQHPLVDSAAVRLLLPLTSMHNSGGAHSAHSADSCPSLGGCLTLLLMILSSHASSWLWCWGTLRAVDQWPLRGLTWLVISLIAPDLMGFPIGRASDSTIHWFLHGQSCPHVSSAEWPRKCGHWFSPL